jgi:chemotaxis signal transduction protein
MSDETQLDEKPDLGSLFARPMPPGYRDELQSALAEAPADVVRETGSTLLFMLGGLGLALPTRVASAVAPSLHIARIPHRSGTVLLGLVAARGDILPCCSLARLLGLSHEGGSPSRTLILEEDAGRRWAIPIDSVIGVRVIDMDKNLQETDTSKIAPHWILKSFDGGGVIIHLLNPDVLFRQMNLATA